MVLIVFFGGVVIRNMFLRMCLQCCFCHVTVVAEVLYVVVFLVLYDNVSEEFCHRLCFQKL